MPKTTKRKKAVPTKASKPNNRLRELRLRFRGPLTQEEVARFMELDFTTVSRHEAGERKPSKRDLERYAALYKVSTYELFLSPASVTAG